MLLNLAFREGSYQLGKPHLREVGERTSPEADGALENHLFQTLQKPVTGGGACAGSFGFDGGIAQITVSR
jgi:hypothetical protein